MQRYPHCLLLWVFTWYKTFHLGSLYRNPFTIQHDIALVLMYSFPDLSKPFRTIQHNYHVAETLPTTNLPHRVNPRQRRPRDRPQILIIIRCHRTSQDGAISKRPTHTFSHPRNKANTKKKRRQAQGYPHSWPARKHSWLHPPGSSQYRRCGQSC